MKKENIDHGENFEWSRTSEDYAKFRDIYPNEFYNYILHLGLCQKGQNVLDIGTGTGVLPRNMAKYGAHWVGTDISATQIEQARILSKDKNIEYSVCSAEELDFPKESFDVITACQCIWYLDAKVTSPLFSKMLKPKGKFLILYMGWLPLEDKIARKSEEIILKYNPSWTGCNDYVHPVMVPKEYLEEFHLVKQEQFCVDIPFSRQGWHGRMRTCRGVGASMSEEELALWEKEHLDMLERVPETFLIHHYISIAVLEKQENKET
ncbi:MAG: class I SAM-dependent methyltransferase [Bacillota bacterium]|nr:class I SAM-dependent methyltransferase [Bacillota bacterium]